MSFDPKRLPASVLQAFRQGAMAWPLALDKALGAGILDLNTLTDIVFYMHFPERIGNPIKLYEHQLISKWKGFRSLVQPRLAGRSGMSSRMTDNFDRLNFWDHPSEIR